MKSIGEEQKAARRKERRKLRRGQQKIEVIKVPIAADIYPMLYDQNTPRTYEEGIQSNAWANVTELEGNAESEMKVLQITCYGRRNNNSGGVVPYRDFSADYYISLDKLSQLGKNKKVTSIDIFNRVKEKKGTLTARDKTFSFLVQRGELAIFGDISKEGLAECMHEKIFKGFTIIIKKAQEPQHPHVWEIQRGVYKPGQTDPTTICTCKCGAKYVTNAPISATLNLPTRGCTIRGEHHE